AGGNTSEFSANITVLQDLEFTAPSDGSADNLVLHLSGGNLVLLDNGVVVKSQPLAQTTGATITGVDLEDDSLLVDFIVGFFALANGITFHGGAAASDSLTVNATANADTIDISATAVTVNGSVITYVGVEDVFVNALGGVDAITEHGGSTPDYHIDGGTGND